MKVFLGVVACILVNSRRIVTYVNAATSTTYESESSSSTVTPYVTEATTIANCVDLEPPIGDVTEVGKTFANTTWTTSQSDASCIPEQLNVTCLALAEDNPDGGQWVRNSSTTDIALDGNETVSVYINDLSPFTNYTCNAILISSSSSSSNITTFQTAKDVCSPPLDLTISNITDTSFLIKWKKPEKNPGVFLTYHVHIQNNGANYYVPDDCGEETTSFFYQAVVEEYVFFEALPYHTYEITVLAENSAGNSSSVNGNTTTNSAASEEPSNVSFTVIALNEELNTISGNLSWNMPCRPNGPIDIFNINVQGHYTLDDSDEDIRNFSHDAANRSEYFITIEDLKPAADYNISIRADGDHHEGSKAIWYFTTEDNVPGPPIVEDITDVGSDFLIVSWKEPLRKAGYITNYTVEITPLGPLYNYDPVNCHIQNETFTEILDGNTLTYNFTKGYPYYTYEVTVAAHTSKGPGNSTSKTANTLSSVPEKPVDFEFQLKQNNITGVLSWRVPCNLNGPIGSFNLTVVGSYTDDSSLTTKLNDTVPYEEGVFTYSYDVALQVAYQYEANVRVVLEVGQDGETSTTNFTTPDGYPGAPSLSDYIEVDPTSFIITWTPPTTKTGIIKIYVVNITSLGPSYETPCSVVGEYFNYIMDGTIQILNFTSGQPYYRYNVSVQASTNRGLGDANLKLITTSQSVPENVRDIEFNVSYPTEEEYNGKVNISFEKPCRLNGRFQDFKLYMVGERPNFEKDVHQGIPTTANYFECQLKPEYTYNFSIVTYNEEFANTSHHYSFSTPAGVPLFSSKLADIKIETEKTNAKFTLRKDYFDEANGKIKYIALYISDKNRTGEDYQFWDGTNWPAPSQIDNGMYYQITRDWWNDFDGVDSVQITIGNDTECNEAQSYCNKLLEENKKYYLIIRLFTQNFYKNSPTIYFKTDGTTKVGVILGIIFGLLGVALIGIGVFFVWRRHLIPLPPLFYPRMSSAKPNTIVTSIPTHKFPQYCKNLENNPEKLTEQYALLGEKTSEIVRMQTTVYSELTENRRKNRYTNILPYDETRVKLKIEEDNEIGSDYINASYIRGFSGKIEYIATQGPLPTTCRDFWKMVIQENVSTIVMVTQFIEQNKEKCFKYFPNNHESMLIGEDMEVRCCTELHFGTYCVRTLQVKKDTTQISVTHMQYLDWPDFNVPKGTDAMLQFCYQFRERLKMEGGYVIVHCSAGVGRTGTLIATDILLQNVEAGRNIDIFNTVLELRKQRTNMVQTQKQYMYIHNLIKDSLEESKIPGCNENVEHLYENVSVLKMTEDDNNLIAKGKEMESQF